MLPAAVSSDPTSLTLIQLEAFRAAFPDAGVEGITCTLETSGSNGRLHSLREFNGLELSQEYLNARKKAPELDFSWVARAEQPGRPLFISDFMTRSEFEACTLYEACIDPLNMHEVFCVSYCNPKDNEFLKVVQRFILSSDSMQMGETRQHDVEYLNVPFILSWLCHMNLISENALVRYFDLLAGVSPMQLAVLREMVNSFQYNAVQVAAKFCISKRTLEAHLYEVYEHAFNALGFERDGLQRSARIVDLVNHYSFLAFCAPVQNKYDFRSALQKSNLNWGRRTLTNRASVLT